MTARRPSRTAGGNGAGGSKWLRTEKRARIHARDGWRCLWCERRAGQVKLTIDHFLARAAGGSNETSNLFSACMRCNTRRKATCALEYAYRIEGPLFGGAPHVLDRIITKLLLPLPRVVP